MVTQANTVSREFSLDQWVAVENGVESQGQWRQVLWKRQLACVNESVGQQGTLSRIVPDPDAEHGGIAALVLGEQLGGHLQ
jgi:hypothetical protein